MRPVNSNNSPSDTEADLVDVQQIRNLIGYVLRSVRRHRPLLVTVFLTVVGLSALLLWMLPRTYHTETKILAQRNLVMPALGNPGRQVPNEADAPTKAASETVMRRDNLISLIKQTNLIDNWELSRAPILRLKDWAIRLVSGPPSEEDKLDALVGLLEKRLEVETNAEEGTVTIGIDWPEAGMAFRLVETAQQNFLEARHAAEVQIIAETISILEGHAANVRDSVERTLEEIQKAQRPSAAAVVSSARVVRRDNSVGEATAQLQSLIAAKRRAIADLEEFRRRRLAEAQAQLGEQSASYGAAHPLISNLKQSIASLSQESPQVHQLKREEAELVAEFKKRGGTESRLLAGTNDDAGATTAVNTAPLSEGAIRQATAQPGDDEVVEYARSRLRMATNKYEELLERLDGARIELETARAAFKYRYNVVNPAKIPKKAEKPNVPVLAIASLFAAFALGVFAAVSADVSKGRILESWQAERALGLPVLAELDRPEGPSL